ncbi:hypothetical protein, partial [Nitratifractor sp.]|uniref:hypothetical protein n=1 Tax=Nitratifractor sp. TaxID=2268144 RepID=UPI002600A8F8
MVRRLSFEWGFAPLCRLNEVGKGRVASRKSQVASSVAFGDVIGYWLLTPLKNLHERFHSMATKERSTRETGACVRDCQSYRVKPVVFQSILLVIGSVAKQRIPKSFTIHHSSFTLS